MLWASDILGNGLAPDSQFGLVLPSGPAAPLPPDVPPEPLLESPGLRVEPGLVFSSVPLAPPLPEPLPAAPPSKELSGEVFGCAPDGADKHPALPATEHPPASGSVVVGAIVESCAKAAAGTVIVATANSMCASFVISSLISVLCEERSACRTPPDQKLSAPGSRVGSARSLASNSMLGWPVTVKPRSP